jgi:hypothetical protein
MEQKSIQSAKVPAKQLNPFIQNKRLNDSMALRHAGIFTTSMAEGENFINNLIAPDTMPYFCLRCCFIELGINC